MNQSTAPVNVCPWCEKPVVVGSVHTDSVGRRWHRFCAERCETPQPSVAELEAVRLRQECDDMHAIASAMVTQFQADYPHGTRCQCGPCNVMLGQSLAERQAIERAIISTWPPFGLDHPGCQYCGEPVTPESAHHHYTRNHAACLDAEGERIAAKQKKNPYDVQHELGSRSRYGPADIRTLDRDSDEGRAELRRRAARSAAPATVDGELAGLAPLLIGVA